MVRGARLAIPNQPLPADRRPVASRPRHHRVPLEACAIAAAWSTRAA